MSLRLNDEFVPPPGDGDGDTEIARLKRLLQEGKPGEQQAALRKLVELRAEDALSDCLAGENLVAAQLATAGLWDCWLNEQGATAREELEKGIQFLKGGELEDALEIFRVLTVKYPQWAEAYNKQATVLYLLGNARLSLKVCKIVVELKPNHFGAWNGMALCAAQMEKWKTALDAATKALKLQPTALANHDIIQLALANLSKEG